jgi:hypothetical protein
MTDPSPTAAASPARRSVAGRLVVGIVLLLAFIAGGVIGGYLHFNGWHANAAMLAVVPVSLALLVAIGAGAWWLVSRRRVAALVAVVAAAYALGSFVGTWVAPEANPPQWSPGTVNLTLDDPAIGTVSGTASCQTEADGSFSVSSDPEQVLADTPFGYSLRGAGADGNRGSIGFDLYVTRDDGGPMWSTNEEVTQRDILEVVLVDGTAAAGEARLVAIARSAEELAGGDAFGGPPPTSLSGVVTWTCEPPRGEPTPIEGSWFG